jgi:hypothetical protein
MTVEYQQLEEFEALEVQRSLPGEALARIAHANKSVRATSTSMSLSRSDFTQVSCNGLPHGFLEDRPPRLATTSARLRAAPHAP